MFFDKVSMSKAPIALLLLVVSVGRLSAAPAPKGPEHEVAVVATSGEYSAIVKKDSNKMAVIQLISSLRGELGKVYLQRSGEVLGLNIEDLGDGFVTVGGWMGDDYFGKCFAVVEGEKDIDLGWGGPEVHLFIDHPDPSRRKAWKEVLSTENKR